jgi:hypothetical protein
VRHDAERDCPGLQPRFLAPSGPATRSEVEVSGAFASGTDHELRNARAHLRSSSALTTLR